MNPYRNGHSLQVIGTNVNNQELNGSPEKVLIVLEALSSHSPRNSSAVFSDRHGMHVGSIGAALVTFFHPKALRVEVTIPYIWQRVYPFCLSSPLFSLQTDKRVDRSVSHESPYIVESRGPSYWCACSERRFLWWWYGSIHEKPQLFKSMLTA